MCSLLVPLAAQRASTHTYLQSFILFIHRHVYGAKHGFTPMSLTIISYGMVHSSFPPPLDYLYKIRLNFL